MPDPVLQAGVRFCGLPFQFYCRSLQVTPDFGPEYIIPKPFDDRLLVEVTSAVAKAAISTGVARCEDFDLLEYRRKLQDLVHRLATQ